MSIDQRNYQKIGLTLFFPQIEFVYLKREVSTNIETGDWRQSASFWALPQHTQLASFLSGLN